MKEEEHKIYTANKRALHAQSRKLAQAVQAEVLNAARSHNKTVVDRKVKYKVSQVLMGVEIPAILIELGFLSHPQERRLLQSDKYQKALAHGIYKGIKTFLQ